MRLGRRRQGSQIVAGTDRLPGPDDLVFDSAGTLRPPEPSAKLLAIGVSFDQTPISLWEEDRTYIVSLGRDGDHVIATESVEARYPTIQSLPGNRVLICGRRVADGSPNAYGGREPANHGIVRFDSSLTAVWKYPFSSPHGAVDDCYTLNVHGESAVSCFYSDFPIVRISGENLSGWTGAPTGAHGLLRSGESVLLFGGYSEDRDRVVRLRLQADGSTEETGRGVVLGVPSDVPGIRFCRGHEAHVFVGADWYRSSM